MIINPSYFRKIGRSALKDHWQTALWVTFLAEIFLTAASLLFELIALHLTQNTSDLLTSFASSMTSGNMTELSRYGIQLQKLLAQNLQSLSPALPIGLLISIVLGAVLTPALKVSEHHYYLSLHNRQELSLKDGVLNAFPVFGKSWCLYALMILKTLLWSLLYIPAALVLALTGLTASFLGILLLFASLIPALLCVIRYMFAPYVLAENRDWGVKQCLKRSKEITHHRKGAVIFVAIIFAIYQLSLSLLISLLESIGLPDAVTMVVSLFASLALSVYSISTFTGLYRVMAHSDVEKTMNDLMRQMMRDRGMDNDSIEQMIHGKRPWAGNSEKKPEDEQKPSDDDEETLN